MPAKSWDEQQSFPSCPHSGSPLPSVDSMHLNSPLQKAFPSHETFFLNGAAVKSVPKDARTRGTGSIHELTIGLEAGRENNINLIAYDAKGELKSKEAGLTVISTAPIRKPRFHGLMVGINQFSNPDITLKYARPDAMALAGVLRERVHPELFSRIVANAS